MCSHRISGNGGSISDLTFTTNPLAPGSGDRRVFELSVKVEGTEFDRRVWELVAGVPYGETTTYGALAERVGHPRAGRAVGTVMNRNRIPIVLPCHRVVGATGDLTGYAGGLDRKVKLLELEGAR